MIMSLVILGDMTKPSHSFIELVDINDIHELSKATRTLDTGCECSDRCLVELIIN